jgi:hypothetical protein
MVWLWMDGIFLVFLIIFAFSVWVVYLSELAKYSRVERYLVAKIGTIYWFWFGGSSSLRVIEVVLFLCWFFFQ